MIWPTRLGDRALRPARLRRHPTPDSIAIAARPSGRPARGGAEQPGRRARHRAEHAPADAPQRRGVRPATPASRSRSSRCSELPEVHRDARGRIGGADARAGAVRGDALDTRAREMPRRRRRRSSPPAAWTAWTPRTAAAAPESCETPDAHSIVWPDYPGNNMFKTIGNIAADGAAGSPSSTRRTARRYTSAATPSSTRPARSR